MPWYKGLSRREFIRLGAAAAATSGVISCSNPKVPWRFFTVTEARILAALSDQIIPSDNNPGAQWAGVVNYIDIQLCGPYQDLRPVYREGLAELDKISTKQFGCDFATLAADSQMTLLKSIEQGKASSVSAVAATQKSFFYLVLDHTMQGFYGDPRHGGNRERTSWKMLALPYPPLRGQQRYGTKS